MSRNERLAQLGIYVVAAVPILILYFGYDVRFKYFVFGSGSWAIGVLVKMLLYHLVIKRVSALGIGSGLTALLNGLSSGLCELGAVLAAFAYLGRINIPEILAVGVGTGSFEAWVVASVPDLLKGTELHSGAEKLENQIKALGSGRRRVYEVDLPVVERITASMIHVGTRVQVYVSYVSGNILPGLCALATFTLVDGWLAYRLLMSATPSLFQLRRVYIWLAVVAGLSLSSGIALIW